MPRGGANTSDHIDILGSTALNELVLKVAVGAGDEIEDSFVSPIREYAARIRWDDWTGFFVTTGDLKWKNDLDIFNLFLILYHANFCLFYDLYNTSHKLLIDSFRYTTVMIMTTLILLWTIPALKLTK